MVDSDRCGSSALAVRLTPIFVLTMPICHRTFFGTVLQQITLYADHQRIITFSQLLAVFTNPSLWIRVHFHRHNVQARVKTAAIDEGLELDEARLKEDLRHSSSLNALMEESRLELIVETSLFVTCFYVIRKIVRAYCSFIVK